MTDPDLVRNLHDVIYYGARHGRINPDRAHHVLDQLASHPLAGATAVGSPDLRSRVAAGRRHSRTEQG